MSTTSAGLSTVSQLVKQNSLENNQQYTSAKQGLEFAETAIKSTMFTYTSQQKKLDQSFQNEHLSKDDYDKQTEKLKRQHDIDRAPWDLYVKKLTELIEKYSPTNQSKRKKQKQSPSSSSSSSSTVKKKSNSSGNAHIIFSSDSSDSDTSTPPPAPAISVTNKTIRYDSTTSTDPLEFSLRSPFPSTPNIIPFTAQINQVIHRIPLQHINEIAAKQIVLLHDEGQLVRWNDVVWRILTYFQVEDLGHLGLQRADQISCIENLIRTQNKINTYLDAYTYWQTLGTINELETDLARIFFKKSFDDLLIGPIEKQPKIDELFRLKYLRTDQRVRKDLKSSDILKYLDQYMTKEYAWKNDKEINLDDFLKFIAEKVQVKTIYQLGIRIKTVYLARNCIKALQANQRKTMEIARTELNQILNDLAQDEVKRIQKMISEKLGNEKTNLELRQMYANMQPLEIINDLIEITREICQTHSSFRKISNVLHAVTSDPMLVNIFQIAICHGQLDQTKIERSKKSEPTVSNKKIYFDSSESDNDEPKKILPNQNELIQEVQQQMNGLKSLNLSFLSRIEQRLCEKFQVKYFHELNHGTFLDFLQKNQPNLISSEMKFQLANTEKSFEQFSFDELEQYIVHVSDPTIDIEQMICYHFRVQSFEQLGHGSYQSVINQIKQKSKPKLPFLHYESLVLNETSFLNTNHPRNLEKQAFDLIEQCPFLENLHLFTQWNRYFRCQLGQLKNFLRRFQICTLEIDCETLLKLPTNSTIELFKQSLDRFDVNLSAGYLVHLLVQSNTISQAPLALLSNVFQTFLYSIELNQQFYEFFKGLLLRIPFLLLTKILQRIFFEPLVKIEGNQMKIRRSLWQTLDKYDQHQINKFIQLGEHFGFTDWSRENLHIEPIPSALILPQSSLTTAQTKSTIISETKISCSGSHPFDVIGQIRREKFGIGLTLSNETEHFTNQLKSLIGRSLEHLSKELYNTDMHFILELIQNADDNHYQTHPSLLFVLDQTSLNIYNNELGFHEEHIRALCDIGKSTKGKHQQGYIGQKGIGFKSVFTITDRPEIYSNGYRICFNAEHGSIGYILPEWIESESRDNEYLDWSTRICLPLKTSTHNQLRSLIDNFNHLHPSILLFLHRLRSIEIHNRLLSTRQVYQRIDRINSNLIEIHSNNNQIDKWFVIKKQLNIPEQIKADIQSTEIALAFPLNQIANTKSLDLIKQDVFAYLPIRTYGFTFIIQADFELPSSRQDILNDNLWNEFLLNEIPMLYLSAIDAFEFERNLLPIDSLRLFLHFLPNENSVYNNLFTSICRKIRQLLSSTRFLPVLNDANRHLPSECIIIHDSTIREFLSPEILYQTFRLFYIRDDLIDFEQQLYELGVQRFESSQLISLLNSDNFICEQKANLSQWFLCLYRYFNELPIESEAEFFKQIQTLKIFPLKNQSELISLNMFDEKIFFSTKNLHLSNVIENDLLILDDQLWINSKSIQIFLEKLGILQLTSKILCEQHIYPMFENENKWKNKSKEILIEYVLFIYDIWLKDRDFLDLTRLKSIIQLSTNEQFRNSERSVIHFSTAYGNPYDLTKDFPGIDWTFLDDEYVRKIHDRKRLHEFFSQLNVRDFLFPLNDQTNQILTLLINKQSRKINRKLFLALQKFWSDENQSILSFLRQSQWIPTIEFIYEENQLKELFRLHRPTNVYQKTKPIESLFDIHVQYLDIDCELNSAFGRDLGLIDRVTIEDFMTKFNHWIDQIEFCTSKEHLNNVYEFLSENLNRNEIREFIRTKSMFFIPMNEFDSMIQGKFVNINEIYWTDPTNLFRKYSWSSRFQLEFYYKSQKTIFLDIFSIPIYPKFDEYIQFLVHLTTLNRTKELLSDVFLVFQTLGKYYPEIDPQLISTKSIFPTIDNRWLALVDQPVISDDEHLADLFSRNAHLTFLDVQSNDEHIQRFFDLCQIRSLSSIVHIEHLVQNPTSGSTIESLLSPLLPFVEMYMKSRAEFSTIYAWTQSINFVSILEHLQIVIVDDLQLIYRLENNSSICFIENEKSFYNSTENRFYFHRHCLEQDIYHSFARIFFPKTSSHSKLTHQLGNFLHLLSNHDQTNLDEFARYQEFQLNFNDLHWKLSSNQSSMPDIQSKINENKVRFLLETIEHDKEQYQAYRQKKRDENRKQQTDIRFDLIQSDSLQTNVEILEDFTKKFNIEDLTRQVVDNRHSTIGSNQQSLEKIGRWGEQWVNEYLRSKYSTNYEITWLNEFVEQGRPYDFILKNLETQSTNYIEVKSTLSSYRQLIPITYNEIQYCCSLERTNEHFQIYRVYNTGQLNKVKLTIVENLEEKLRKHQLELFLLI